MKESSEEWNGVLLSSVLRVGSVCVGRRLYPYVSDGCTRIRHRPDERNLPKCIRPRHLGPISGFMVWGAISYSSQSHLVFLQGRVNSSRYITQVVNAVLLPFLRQEGDVLFQQDNARLHTAAGTQLSLRGVQQLPWPARSPDISPMEHIWDMMKRELTLSPEPATTIAELRKRVQNAWDSPFQDDILFLIPFYQMFR